MSGTWEVSPTVTVSGAGAYATALVALPSFAASALEEKFMIEFPTPIGVFTNDLFYTALRDICVTGQRASSNAMVSGVKIGGSQGTQLRDVWVTEMGLRGVVADGCMFERTMIANIT